MELMLMLMLMLNVRSIDGARSEEDQGS